MDRLSNGFYEYTIAGGSVLFLRIFIAKSPKEQTILCDVKMNSTSTVLFVNIVAILAKCTTETIDNIPVILKDDSDCQYMTPHYRKRLPKEAAELKKIMKSDNSTYAEMLSQKFKLLSIFFASLSVEGCYSAGDTERNNPITDDWINRISDCILNSLDSEMRQKIETTNCKLQEIEKFQNIVHANMQTILRLAEATLKELDNNNQNGKEDA